MTEAPADRTYYAVPGRFTWHAIRGWAEKNAGGYRWFEAVCGRPAGDTRSLRVIMADRVPRDGHLCGSCARVIAARTDIENHSVTATAGIP